MVININNSPVSAYLHLNHRLAPANRERSFPMLDHMVCLSADLFRKSGGFSPKAGIYALMDLCLKIRQHTKNNNACVFLPGLQILKTHDVQEVPAGDALFFLPDGMHCFGKMKTASIQSEGISPQQLDAARMAQAQKQVKAF